MLSSAHQPAGAESEEALDLQQFHSWKAKAAAHMLLPDQINPQDISREIQRFCQQFNSNIQTEQDSLTEGYMDLNLD